MKKSTRTAIVGLTIATIVGMLVFYVAFYINLERNGYRYIPGVDSSIVGEAVLIALLVSALIVWHTALRVFRERRSGQ